MTQRTPHPHEKTSNGKKKLLESRLELKVRNDSRQSGYTIIDFRFLSAWLGDEAELFLDGIAKFSRRYSSAAPTYAARRVLQHWNELQRRKKWPNPNATSAREFEKQIAALRQSFYIEQTETGIALTTTTNKWNSFISLIETLVMVSAVPPVVIGGTFMLPPRKSDIIMDRDSAVGGVGAIPTPKTFNREKNSFNEELLEPISIIASDDEYLQEYTARLGHAVETIKLCAMKDFELLQTKQEEGRLLVAETDQKFLKQVSNLSSNPRYIDKSTGNHYLSKHGGHPNLLGNILTVVKHEMGGIPKPHRKFKSDGTTVEKSSGNSHWYFVQQYGKNKLLPYLGVMSSEAAVICVLLLMLEHPALNATSLYRARIENESGRSLLLSSTEEGSRQRLSVDKPRAGEEKSVVLSELGQKVILKVLEWTAPVREELKKQGRYDEAKRLWVGISRLNYNLLAFSEKALMNGLRNTEKFRYLGKSENQNRITPFVYRHACLAPWLEKITFKAIRINVGILTYLKTDGDLVATAKAFGHKSVKTTIGHYIPRALRLAVFERQIRRHQNFLITSSLSSEKVMLKTSDFRTVEELHSFLQSCSFGFAELEQETSAENVTNVQAEDALKSRIVVANDPDALAVAMLYRDSLEHATPTFINKPDSVTGVAPKFWIDFVETLLKPLPLAMADISSLMRKALIRKKEISLRIVLPEIK